MNTLFGTNKADNINGTDSADTIYGYKGDDDLDGKLGDDTIYGGEGNDVLTGGKGNDFLYGGVGNDFLIGDGLFDGSGNNSDFLDGGKGDDILSGGYGNNILVGGKGNDYLKGYNGRGDSINQLTGGEKGGKGDKTRDVFELGAGDSYFYLDSNPSQSIELEDGRAVVGLNSYALITDYEDGIDKLQLPNGTLASNIVIANINYNGIQGTAFAVGGEGGPPGLIAILQGVDSSTIGGADFIYA